MFTEVRQLVVPSAEMEAEGASQGVPAAPTPAGQPPPPPSPLSGAYLLIIVGEPYTDVHKKHILDKIANGKWQQISPNLINWQIFRDDQIAEKSTCYLGIRKRKPFLIYGFLQGYFIPENHVRYRRFNILSVFIFFHLTLTLFYSLRKEVD